MSTQARTQNDPELAQGITVREKAIIFGDITGLDERGRLDYLQELCKQMGLNPITRPFGYLPLRDGLMLYLTAAGGAQLRLLHRISVTEIADEGVVNGFYRVKVYGRMPNGRVDVEYGSVSARYKDGKDHPAQELENDRKKAITQAKTRLAKSMTGLAGILSEEEAETIQEPRTQRHLEQGKPAQIAQVSQMTSDTESAEARSLALAQRLYGVVCEAHRASTGLIMEPLSADAGIVEYGSQITDLLDSLASAADAGSTDALTEATEARIATARGLYADRGLQLELPLSYEERGAQAILAALRSGLMKAKATTPDAAPVAPEV